MHRALQSGTAAQHQSACAQQPGLVDGVTEQPPPDPLAAQFARHGHLRDLELAFTAGPQRDAANWPAVQMGHEDLTTRPHDDAQRITELLTVRIFQRKEFSDPSFVQCSERQHVVWCVQRRNAQGAQGCGRLRFLHGDLTVRVSRRLYPDVQYLVQMQRDAPSIGRGLELRHLRAFVAVAEELHFGRAAQRLNLAQPPLSQQIRQLEALIGTPLFVRTSRSVRLTLAGVALLARARRTLSNVQDDVLEARRIGEGAVGVLRVGFAGSVILSVLPGLLSRYRAELPGIDLKLRESFTAQVIDALLGGDLDAGVVRDGDPTPGVTLHPMYAEPFVAVLPAGHPAAALSAVPVTVLQSEPWVYYPRSAGTRAFEKPLSVCEAHGFRPIIHQEASHWLTIVELVGAGLGVSMAPACVARIAPQTVVCRALRGVTLTSEVQFAQRQDEQHPLVQAFKRLALSSQGDAGADGLPGGRGAGPA